MKKLYLACTTAAICLLAVNAKADMDEYKQTAAYKAIDTEARTSLQNCLKDTDTSTKSCMKQTKKMMKEKKKEVKKQYKKEQKSPTKK